MRSFEFKDGKSNKFWNIELEGKSFTVTYGRIGTDGQTQTKEFADAAKTKAAHDKLVAEKVGKGYVETTGGAVTTSTKSGKALENAILANPDDLAAHAAYADWLSEQGDPRGEFIQVQLALEDPKKPAKERKELQKREQQLLKRHQREWLGELAPLILDKQGISEYYREHEIPLRFARGWLESLHVPYLTVDFSRALAREPKTRLLRNLTVHYVGRDDDEDHVFERGKDIPRNAHYYIGIYPLRESPNLRNIRVFQLGTLGDNPDEDRDDYRYFHSSDMGATAADLVAKMPAIEELYLFTRRVDFATLFNLKSLGRLRVLQVYHMNQRYPLERLAKNPSLGKLTHLLLHPHFHTDHDPDEIPPPAYIDLAGVRALVRSPHLQSLTHLRLRVSDMGDDGCREIVSSGIVRRLKVLDLRHGRIADEGAQILAHCPDLKNLEHLDVDRNALTKTGIAALRKVLGKRVRADDQQSSEELANAQYLCEGDFE